MKHPSRQTQHMSLSATLRNPDVDRQVEGIFAIEREMRALLDSRLALNKITYAQFSLLRFLAEPFDSTGKPLDRAPTATDVADHFGFANRTVTVGVNALAAKGWVLRRKSAIDKRCAHIAVTASGLDVLSEALIEYLPIQRLFHLLPRRQEQAVAFAIPRLLDGIRALQRQDKIRKRKTEKP